MTEIVLRRHRSRLLQRDAIEGCIAHDADLAVLEAEAGDQFGRRLGGHHGRGQQQKACGHPADCTPCHRPEKSLTHQTSCYARPLLHRQCGRFKARAVCSVLGTKRTCRDDQLESAFRGMRSLGLSRRFCGTHRKQRLCNGIVRKGPQNIFVTGSSLIQFASLEIE